MRDHAGRLINGSYNDNAGQSAVPTVTMYVTGAGENFESSMTDSDNDGVWGATFTPQRPGDHKVIIKASDDHQYWVDGRGSTMLVITGNFPYASLGLPFILRSLGDLGSSIGLKSLAVLFASLIGAIAARRRWTRG